MKVNGEFSFECAECHKLVEFEFAGALPVVVWCQCGKYWRWGVRLDEVSVMINEEAKRKEK